MHVTTASSNRFQDLLDTLHLSCWGCIRHWDARVAGEAAGYGL